MILDVLYNKARIKLLSKKGEKEHLIEDFPKELWDKLENCYYCGNPVSVLLSCNYNLGKCYDRSYALTMAFEDFKLVRGNLTRFGIVQQLEHDPNFVHGWVEDDKYVYDTTFLKRYDKDFYYSLYGAEAENVISSEELKNDEYYMKMKATTKYDIEDSLGLDTLNAILMNKILRLKEEKEKSDLSKLKKQMPQVDLEEYNRRQEDMLKEMMAKEEKEVKMEIEI